MAETLTDLNETKYEAHETAIAGKRRRQIEDSESDLIKIVWQIASWCLGKISGDDAVATAALTELETLYDEDITPPNSEIGATVTETNTRRGVGVSLVEGNNTVTFSSALSAATYSLAWNCYTASGGQVVWTQDPATRTVNGFQISVVAACKIDYIAILN